MMSMNVSDIAILNSRSVYYCCINSRISKNKVINVMENAHLTTKSETL